MSGGGVWNFSKIYQIKVEVEVEIENTK